MNRLRFVVGTMLAAALLLAAPYPPAKGADVKARVGFPTGVVVTLSHQEARIIGRGGRLDIPGLPAKFEAPLRKLAAKIRTVDKGNGVKVTLTVKVFPKPGIGSKVEAL